MFNVGDKVETWMGPHVSGRIIKIFGGTGNLLIRTHSGDTIIIHPKSCRLLEKEKKNGL